MLEELTFGTDWDEVLLDEFEKLYFRELRTFLKKEYAEELIYPQKEELGTAFKLTPFNKVKVVILGQDPYHGPGQAHGLSFSVKPGVKHPPSLRNIFKELHIDLGCEVPEDGTLTHWAEQGVFLLNTVLTVRAGLAHSHKGRGWETFTDEAIKRLSERETPIVFVLWGRPAQEKKKLIDETKHSIIEAFHPSPLSASRGFFGSRPFSKVNQIVEARGEKPIDWCL